MKENPHSAKATRTLLLNGHEVSRLLPFDECIGAVESAFRLHAEGKSLRPGLLHVESQDGEFHIKAGGLELGRQFFGLKVNGSFFHNATRFDMPSIQGVILLSDAENGYPLAIMDSREITAKRTGAATAVAAKYLARSGSETVTVCGCGTQGRAQLRALAHVLPIKRVFAFARDVTKAVAFAREMEEELEVKVIATEDLKTAAAECDVCVTCTPSRQYFLSKDSFKPGTFIAAVGADSPTKQELDPSIMRSSKVVVDLLEQCAEVGELHHAIKLGMRKEDVYAELGEIVSGKKPGRTSEEEIIVFDSTGTALQDVAAAAAVYQKSLQLGEGRAFDFFS
jgi:alanine dehydrogenase